MHRRTAPNVGRGAILDLALILEATPMAKAMGVSRVRRGQIAASGSAPTGAIRARASGALCPFNSGMMHRAVSLTIRVKGLSL